jgi:peroxiredoxin
MARPDSRPLDTGDLFPNLDVTLVDGRKLSLPRDLTHPFEVVLLNRGHWCPFCNAQLRAFQSGLEKLTAEGIGVLSASVDTLEQAQGVVSSNDLRFPVAYGLPVVETAGALGSFYDATPAHTSPYLQSTGFVLGPDRRVIVASYSTSAIGRLVWQDVLGLVQYVKRHQ